MKERQSTEWAVSRQYLFTITVPKEDEKATKILSTAFGLELLNIGPVQSSETTTVSGKCNFRHNAALLKVLDLFGLVHYGNERNFSFRRIIPGEGIKTSTGI